MHYYFAGIQTQSKYGAIQVLVWVILSITVASLFRERRTQRLQVENVVNPTDNGRRVCSESMASHVWSDGEVEPSCSQNFGLPNQNNEKRRKIVQPWSFGLWRFRFLLPLPRHSFKTKKNTSERYIWQASETIRADNNLFGKMQKCSQACNDRNRCHSQFKKAAEWAFYWNNWKSCGGYKFSFFGVGGTEWRQSSWTIEAQFLNPKLFCSSEEWYWIAQGNEEWKQLSFRIRQQHVFIEHSTKNSVRENNEKGHNSSINQGMQRVCRHRLQAFDYSIHSRCGEKGCVLDPSEYLFAKGAIERACFNDQCPLFERQGSPEISDLFYRSLITSLKTSLKSSRKRTREEGQPDDKIANLFSK